MKSENTQNYFSSRSMIRCCHAMNVTETAGVVDHLSKSVSVFVLYPGELAFPSQKISDGPQQRSLQMFIKERVAQWRVVLITKKCLDKMQKALKERFI